MTLPIHVTNFLYKSCATCFAVLFLGFTLSCTKTSDKDDSIYFIFGNASGLQQLPQVSTPGTGTLDGTFDVTNHTLNYSISWNGLLGAVTAIGLHGPANIGASADVLTELPVNIKSPTGHASGSVSTDDLMRKLLVDGRVYYTISTSVYPDGEIRGQVIAVHE